MELRNLICLRPQLRNHPPNLLRSQSQRRSPKVKANICLADYLTSTKRIRVRWDQILIDTSRTEGQIRGLNPDRVQARYEDLLRAPPPDVIDNLLLVPGVRTFCTCLVVGHCHCTAYVLTVAVCLAGFWYAVGGQHIYTAAMQHRKEMEKKNHPLPTWTKEFEAFEIKRGTPLPIRRQLGGLHQVQTTSSSVSTTSERMRLLLEHIAEDLGVPLLTHVQNMLAEVGMTAEEGSVVCGTCFQC